MFLGLNRFCTLSMFENKIVLTNHHTEAYSYISPKLAILLLIINDKNDYDVIIREIQKILGVSREKSKSIVDFTLKKLSGYITYSKEKAVYGDIMFDLKDIINDFGKITVDNVSNLPSQIHLMMTNHCNHSCIYCEKNAIYANECDAQVLFDYLTPDVVNDVLRTCKENNAKPHFVLTGGEPLLSPYILTIVETIKKYGFETMLVTKGISDFVKFEELCKCGVDIIRFSLDSCFEEKEDILAGKGTYAEIMNCLNIAKKYNSKIIINTVLMLENYSEIEEMVKFCVDKGVKIVHFVVVRPQGRCHNDLALTQEQMLICKNKTIELQEKYRELIRIIFTCDYTNCTEDICKNCAKRFEVINVHKGGVITSCGQKMYLGSVMEEGLIDIWKKHIIKSQNA